MDGTNAGARHLCTMCDAGYLHFVLTHHEALREHSPDWHLHVVCLDERAFEVLCGLDRPGLSAIPFEELLEAEPDLRIVREVRPFGEFARACKPHAIKRVLDERPAPEVVTWLDADAMAFAPIDPILDELGSASILLAPQGVPPAFRRIEERTGRYMGGLVSFRNDEVGRSAVEWWRRRCLVGGCPRVPDHRRFGDQKYLQGMAEEFSRVAVVSRIELYLAPCNIECHEVTRGPSGPLVDGRQLILFQYTGYADLDGARYRPTYPPWRLTKEDLQILYEPFRERRARVLADLAAVSPELADVAAEPDALRDRLMGAGSRARSWGLRGRERLRSPGRRT